MATKQKKKLKNKSKQTKPPEKLIEVFRELHSDIDYLRYIITSREPKEVKEDMLFSLHNCLSNRAQKLAEQIWG